MTRCILLHYLAAVAILCGTAVVRAEEEALRVSGHAVAGEEVLTRKHDPELTTLLSDQLELRRRLGAATLKLRQYIEAQPNARETLGHAIQDVMEPLVASPAADGGVPGGWGNGGALIALLQALPPDLALEALAPALTEDSRLLKETPPDHLLAIFGVFEDPDAALPGSSGPSIDHYVRYLARHGDGAEGLIISRMIQVQPSQAMDALLRQRGGRVEGLSDVIDTVHRMERFEILVACGMAGLHEVPKDVGDALDRLANNPEWWVALYATTLREQWEMERWMNRDKFNDGSTPAIPPGNTPSP